MKFNTVLEAINYIENSRGSHLGLERMEKALNEIDNPHLKLKTIHIGGTNGKGSTTTFLRSVLENSGLRVGTFTSPYLISFNDRIRINNEFISDDDLLSLTNEYYHIYEKYELTFFEILTFISFVYFFNQNVDLVIYEVGLGGRLDSTNVIRPIVSGITNVSLEHTEILGDTVEKIAFEKAGIIKENTPIYTTEEKEEALNVFKDIASKRNAELTLVDSKSIDYKLGIEGIHQIKNANLALSIIKQLQSLDYNIQESNIVNGLANARWEGRFETISDNPKIILDGAHNPNGINNLISTLKNNYSDKNIHILFSALEDKDISNMIKPFYEITENISFTTFDFYRAASINSYPSDNPFYNNWEDAINTIKSQINNDDIFVITGSLYFISRVRNYIINKST